MCVAECFLARRCDALVSLYVGNKTLLTDAGFYTEPSGLFFRTSSPCANIS